MKEHVIGKPIYHVDDEVSFTITMQDGEKITCSGKVAIVDAYGTFEQNEEPSYDILVENWPRSGGPCLVKHIRESFIN